CTMVAAAKQDEIVDRRLAALRPVADMVGVDEPAVLAAREAAACVARPQCASQRGGDRPRSATVADDRGVARQPARRLRRKRAAVVEHAAADIALEGRFVGVNDNLVALPARAGLSRACERGICDRDERLAVRDLATRTRFRGTALLPERVAPRIQRAQEKRAVLGGKTAMHLERSVLVPEDAQVRVLVLRACLAVRDKPVG